MANLKTGSSGSDVKKLQQALVDAGYNVGSAGVDGVFGSATAAAVKKYQQDNGLAVDGIAGQNTLGLLYGTKNNTLTTPTATQNQKNGFTYDAFNYDKQFTYDDFNYGKEFTYDDFNYDKQFSYGDFSYGDFSYADYAESEAVKQANALLQQQIAAKPGAYQSQWQDEINDYMNKIQNRDPFSYDFNSDALYQQYKDNYVQQGQMAMMDTMGQAAAMTGGYGSSYAQTVGQQAYNQQLSQLNNVMPELYQMAHDRYAYEGQQLQDMYNMYMGREEQDYGRYQDDLGNWYNQLQYLTNRYDTERAEDYGRWESDRNLAYDQYTSDRSYAYDQWQSGRDLAYDQYTADKNLAYNQWESGRDLAYDQYTSDRNLAYDQWQTGRDQAFSEYTADKNLAYDQYTADRELAWNEYIAQQEKDQAAAELMAGTGNYDRLKDVYGLSDDEIAKIKEANTPKATGGTGTPLYKTPSDDDIEKFDKAILDGTLSSDYLIEDYAYRHGFDPAYLKYRVEQLVPAEEPELPEVPLLELPDNKKPKKTPASGGGGGTYYYEVR